MVQPNSIWSIFLGLDYLSTCIPWRLLEPNQTFPLLMFQKSTSCSRTFRNITSAFLSSSSEAFCKRRLAMFSTDWQYLAKASLPHLSQVSFSSCGVLEPSPMQWAKLSWYTASTAQNAVIATVYSTSGLVRFSSNLSQCSYVTIQTTKQTKVATDLSKIPYIHV